MYNRFGSSSPYGGGYGSGYGSGYGGYGSGYGGYGANRFGGGYGSSYNRPGMYGGQPMGPNGGPLPPGEVPLTARVEQSTATAFQTIDQIVQAFGGFSQMLESTFFATHSSFMAMVGVAEQFGYLRGYLARVLDLWALWNAVRGFLGVRPRVDSKQLSSEAFGEFEAKEGVAGVGADGKAVAKKPSGRPFWVFVALLFGLPWLMSKLIKRLQKARLEEAAAGVGIGPNGEALPIAAVNHGGPHGGAESLQPSQIKDLQFCKALYDFKGESPAEISFSKGDIVAVLSKVDPVTKQPSMWWRGRLRSGPVGYFPSNYCELIEKKPGGGQTAQPMQTPHQVGSQLDAGDSGAAFSVDDFKVGV
ncbi:Peroxisomal membrane protein PAS20 [Irineochytrium annulatum]|nr:Peroxisomal membrane protein PAS20 [Irineochytrium annulatum]